MNARVSDRKLERPITWRPDEETSGMLRELRRRSGLPMADIVRRACAAALPKFLSGEVRIVEVAPEAVGE